MAWFKYSKDASIFVCLWISVIQVTDPYIGLVLRLTLP